MNQILEVVMKSARWKLASVLVLVGMGFPAVAGARIFLSVPNVAGESTVAGFVDQIEVTSISFGFSAPVDPATLRQPAVFVAPVTITKQLDKATTGLIGLGAKGTRSTSMVLKQRLESVANTPVFMTVTMKNVAVTDVQIIAGQDDAPFEQVTFLPTSVTVEYVQIGNNGAVGNKSVGSFGEK